MSWKEIGDGKEGKMKRIIAFMVLWLLICFGLLCSADVVLDLSKDPGRLDTMRLSMNIDRLLLRNFIPNMVDQYKIKIEVLEFVPKKLEFPEAIVKAVPCVAVRDLVVGFNNININDVNVEWDKAESKIDQIYKELEKAKSTDKCDDGVSKAAAENILSLQNKIIGESYILKEGEQIAITVTRGKYIWTYSIYRPHGDWFVGYGFSFICPFFNKPDKFFITGGPEGEQTFLLKESSRKAEWDDMEFVPSVFFWWMPAKTGKWNIGPTAGLGFDMKAPAVFAGIALVYHYNIGFNAGVAFHKLKLLRDQYLVKDKDGEFPVAGTEIKENLSDDQLYDSTYRLNLFISVTFRFGSNPFKSGEK
jgi:hypothetical protein